MSSDIESVPGLKTISSVAGLTLSKKAGVTGVI